MGQVNSNFFGSLISESGLIGSLSSQPMVGRAGLGQVARFDKEKKLIGFL